MKHTTIKKIITFVVFFISLFSFSIYPETRPLTVWISWEGKEILKSEILRFASENHCSIDVQYIPKIKSKLSAVTKAKGNLPDVFLIKSDYVPSLFDYNLFEDLSQNIPKFLTPKGIKAFTYRGKIVAIPFYFDTQIMLYNKKLTGDINQISLPLEKLETIARGLKNRGFIPMAWNAYSAYWLLPFEIGFGKNIETPQNIAVINDSHTENAINYIMKLKKESLLHVLFRNAIKSQFMDNKIGFILTGSYAIPDFEKAKIDFGVLTFPFIQNTNRYISPLLDFKGWAIYKGSKNKDLAKRLIRYLTDSDTQRRIAEKLYKIPTNSSVWPDIKNKYFKVFFKSYEMGSVIIPSDEYVIYKNTMWKLLRFIIGKKMGVREALDKGQKTINANLKDR